MDAARRREVLQALGIELWVARAADLETPAGDEPVSSGPAESAVPVSPEAPTPVPESPVAPVAGLDWPDLESSVAGCRRCGLSEERTQTVFGVGARTADWMIVGEAPGAEEDRQGEPFVGAAGQLLNQMLRAVGFRREQVFIANTLKCRPPGNRDPHADELAACRPYLDRQIELVRPRLLLVVGRIAAQALLASDLPIGRLRGRVHTLPGLGIPVVATYHPAYLLRSPEQKRRAWHDLLLACSVAAPEGDGGAR